jgi:hypothetical protein
MRGQIHVVRVGSDGAPICSVPCVFCRREILRFGLRVYCIQQDGTLYCGSLRDAAAPQSKPTSGQKFRMKHLLKREAA